MTIGLLLKMKSLNGFTWIQRVVRMNRLLFSFMAFKVHLMPFMMPLPTMGWYQLVAESFYRKHKRDGIQFGVDLKVPPGGP